MLADIIAINLPPKPRHPVTKPARSLEVETEPVIHDLDAVALARGPATRLAELIGDNLRKSVRRASAGTIRYRRWAERVWRTGQPASAKRDLERRYRGRQPPDGTSTQYGVDSGLLADGIEAHPGDGDWAIAAPGERGEREWRGSRAAYADWLRVFAEIADVRGILSSPEWRQALRASLAGAIGTLDNRAMRPHRGRLRQQWRVVRGFRLLGRV